MGTADFLLGRERLCYSTPSPPPARGDRPDVARKRPDPRPPSQAEDQRAALFAGVREASDDDAPRLVLADCLDEHGDEDDRRHADLIRVQCETLRRAACLIDPDRPEPIHALLRMVGYHNNTLPQDFK